MILAASTGDPAVTALAASAYSAANLLGNLAFGVLTAGFSAGAIVGPLATRALDGVMPPFAVAALVAVLGMGVALPLYRRLRLVAPLVGPWWGPWWGRGSRPDAGVCI
ncbi:MAG TPA: hypothetical protein VK464_23365 [Symbiobacteriaceae bacterium]|nr:hypothetical protein [Symbiobacteriaceae bacterium]